ncbi:RNA polymerase II-binding domain-domain-containing protein [Microdochium bolleyi]|uniref:RNA polymerase II-binding domain-domain-containing protein n=1 Tax=Microdochium bolleyi TaxID=196109 RepID=A0A136J6M9_9PEZI|nr:RNA polymerase II-binding domain-domain-containing protein [Microdochium bolleyi]
MSYNDDAVLAKLSGLAETQDSIVTVAQWIMFHRRHADRTVQLWLQRLKDSPSHKRLNLIYLANEVTQQSKARHKEDFLVAFSPVIAEAVSVAYKGAPLEVQTRVKRVVDVWRERGVFEEPIQQAAEARLAEIDKTRGTTKTGLSGNIFGGGGGPTLPSELAPLATPQQNVTKSLLPMKTAVSNADQEFEKLMGPSAVIPSAPVYAARLSALLKTLAHAEGAVEQCVKYRRTLVGELQKILETNRTALIAEEDQLENLTKKKDDASNKKSDVERAILAGLPSDESYAIDGYNEQAQPEPEQPEMEALTPPSEPEAPEDTQAETATDQQGTHELATEPVPVDVNTIIQDANLQRIVVAGTNGTKKRRLDDDNGFPDLGGEGIDADVADILRRDSSGGQ